MSTWTNVCMGSGTMLPILWWTKRIQGLFIFRCPLHLHVLVRGCWYASGSFPDPDWEETLAHLAGFDRLTYLLLRLVFQTNVYMVWKERNDRRHLQKPRQISQLAKVIGRTVRNQILSVNYPEKPRLRGLMQLWFNIHT